MFFKRLRQLLKRFILYFLIFLGFNFYFSYQVSLAKIIGHITQKSGCDIQQKMRKAQN